MTTVSHFKESDKDYAVDMGHHNEVVSLISQRKIWYIASSESETDLPVYSVGFNCSMKVVTIKGNVNHCYSLWCPHAWIRVEGTYALYRNYDWDWQFGGDPIYVKIDLRTYLIGRCPSTGQAKKKQSAEI